MNNIDFNKNIYYRNIIRETISGPGPKQLIAGDMNAGFYGDVSSGDLIDGNSLAQEINFTAGTSKDAYIGWLKCSIDNKTIYIAKRTLRSDIAWGDMYSSNIVYGPEETNENITEITIDGKVYVVRLMKGANEDPTTLSPNDNWDDPSEANQSEWKKLMQPLEQNSQWGAYPSDSLGFTNSTGNQTWCQETTSSNSNYHVLRGVNNSLDLYTRDDENNLSLRGWRPVLELIG